MCLLFMRLRDCFPSARIILAAHPAYAAPLLDAGVIDEILDGGAPPFHLLYNAQPRADDALSQLLATYDTCVFYSADISGELRKRLKMKGLERCRIHAPLPPPGVHVCAWTMRPWWYSDTPPLEEVKLHPSPKNSGDAHKILIINELTYSKFFVLHPGGGGREKWVPPEILTEAGRRYEQETGHRPSVVEGPADAAACAAFLHAWGTPVPVLRGVGPETLSALFSMCSTYIGGDSGVSHLASLYAPSTTVLYGPASDMQMWRPVGAGTRCVRWEEIRSSVGKG